MKILFVTQLSTVLELTNQPKWTKIRLNTIVKCYISALQELKITLWSLELGNNIIKLVQRNNTIFEKSAIYLCSR